jgi:hypothetical protein
MRGKEGEVPVSAESGTAKPRSFIADTRDLTTALLPTLVAEASAAW